MKCDMILIVERRRIMETGKAATRAKNKYKAKAYDRIEVVVPKGRKETIQDHAAAVGQSINAYVVQAVDERMERDKGAEE